MGANIPPTVSFDAPSETQASVRLTTVGGDKTMPSVSIPTYATLVRAAYLIFKARKVYNSSGISPNNIDGTQYIEASGDAFTNSMNAIKMTASTVSMAAVEYSGMMEVVGTYDISTEVLRAIAGSTTLSVRWKTGLALAANLVFYDVSVELRIIYI